MIIIKSSMFFLFTGTCVKFKVLSHTVWSLRRLQTQMARTTKMTIIIIIIIILNFIIIITIIIIIIRKTRMTTNSQPEGTHQLKQRQTMKCIFDDVLINQGRPPPSN